MRYDSPELRRQLAADYVLGTMPRRARRRFERLVAEDRQLAQAVAFWAERLSPLDDATPEMAPPASVWHAVDQRTAEPPPSPAIAEGAPAISESAPAIAESAAAKSLAAALAFWRGLALAAAAAAAVVVIYFVGFAGRAPAPVVVAVLETTGGTPGWVAITGPGPGEVSFATVTPRAEAKPHAFELWGIAGGGAPRRLGLLPPDPGRTATLRLAQLPAEGGVLAVSLEPPGGSPTGAPTGPVLYQGRILARPP
jgi:anti-sigma-K factor RskA